MPGEKIPTVAQIVARARKPVAIRATADEVRKIGEDYERMRSVMEKHGVQPSFSSEGGLAIPYARMSPVMAGPGATGFGEWLHLRFQSRPGLSGGLQMAYHLNLYRGHGMLFPGSGGSYAPYTAKEKVEIRKQLWSAMDHLEAAARELFGG